VVARAKIGAMSSNGRLVAAQLTLAAAFGLALAWKTMREREAEMQPLDAAEPEPLPASRVSAALAPLLEVPRPLLFGAAAIVVGLVPVIVGLAITLGAAGGGADAVASPGASASVAAPTATVVVAAPTADLAEQLRDVRRQQDLAEVRNSLVAYALYFGSYPSTGGVLTTLCAQNTDAGCELAKYSKDMPVSDGAMSYWYASDGHSFTLLARVETPPQLDHCPSKLPLALGNFPVYCITGALSAP
jgi:hypothetical protein